MHRYSWLAWVGALAVALVFQLYPAYTHLLTNLGHLALLDFSIPGRAASSQPAQVDSLLRAGDFRLPGIYQVNTGAYADGQATLLRRLAEVPGDWDARLFLGLAYYHSGKIAMAFPVWEQLGHENISMYFINQASAALEAGQVDKAIENAGLAVQFDVHNGVAYYWLAKSYAARGDLKTALLHYIQAVEILTDKELLVKAYAEMGAAYETLGDRQAGLSALEQAVALANPLSSYYLHINLADLYAKSGRYDQAYQQLDMAIQLKPKIATAYIEMGNLFSLQGSPEKTLEWYNRAISADPKSGKGEYALGIYLINQGQFAQAAQYLERAIALGNDAWWVRASLGNAYRKAGETQQALKAYRQVVEAEGKVPQVLNSWIALAELYAQAGDPIHAKQAYQVVLKLDPKNKNAMNYLEAHP